MAKSQYVCYKQWMLDRRANILMCLEVQVHRIRKYSLDTSYESHTKTHVTSPCVPSYENRQLVNWPMNPMI